MTKLGGAATSLCIIMGLAIISLYSGGVIASPGYQATSVGVYLEYLGEGPNVESLPLMNIQLDVPVVPSLRSLSIDTTLIRTKIKDFELRNGVSSVKIMLLTLGTLNDAIKSINSFIVEIRAKEPKRARRGTRSRRFLSGGIIGGFINLLFGGGDSGSAGNKKAIETLSKGLKETNKGVANNLKSISIIRNMEKTNFRTMKKEVSDLHNQTVSAFNRVDTALFNISGRLSVLSDKVELVESLQFLLATVLKAELTVMSYSQVISSVGRRLVELEALAAVGKITPSIVPHDMLQKSVQDMQNMLSPLGLGVKYTGQSVTYYYTIDRMMVLKSDEHYIFSVPVPLVSAENTAKWFKVHKWPVNTGNSSSGTCILDLPECVGITGSSDSKLAFTDCGNLRFSGHSVSLSTPGILDSSLASSCISAIVEQNAEKIDEVCHIGLCQLNGRTMSRVGYSTYAIHGKQSYNIRCGTEISASKECEDCIVRVPCKCVMVTKTATTPISFSGCTGVLSVVHSVPRYLVKKFSKDPIKIPVNPEYGSRPKVDLPKELDFPVNVPNIAKQEKESFDADKALDTLSLDTTASLRRSDQDIEIAKSETSASSADSFTEIAVVILIVWVGGLTAGLVYLAFFKKETSIIEKVEGLPTLGPINVIVKQQTSLSTGSMGYVHYTLITVASIVGILTGVCTLRKGCAVNRKIFHSGPDESEEFPLTELSTHVLIIGASGSIHSVRALGQGKKGKKGVFSTTSGHGFIQGKPIEALVPDGQYDYLLL